MARQADDAHVVGEIFAAELRAESDLVRLFQHLLLQFHVAERASRGVARGGQVVVVVGGGELHGQQVLLCRGAADDEGNVVGGASRRAEALHLLYHERHQRGGVQDGLGLLVQVSLVGRAASLGNAEETVFHTFRSLDVNLCGEVALGVHLLIHAQRGVLAVAQVLLRISLVDAFREGLLIAIAGPHLLAFLAVDDGRAGVLAEGQHALAGHLGVAKERQGHVLVIVAGFGVVQNLGHLLVVRTAQHERHVAEGRVCHRRQTFGSHLQDGVSLKLADRHIILGQQIVFSIILARLEHRCILEFRCICHNRFV